MSNHNCTTPPKNLGQRGLALLVSVTFAGMAAAQTISQAPLSAGGNVPGNMVLTPSVEWPTLDSVANLDAVYSPSAIYVGYFDPEKCYDYHYSTTEEDRYFYPSSIAGSSHTCSGKWSGNFLNWATTQTIDPFRKALTGGQRRHSTSYPETADKTILVKAWADTLAGDTIFPDQEATSSTYAGATPVGSNWGYVKTRIRGLGIKMRFTHSGDLGTATHDYQPGTSTFTSTNRSRVYELSVRVKVCDASVGLESNCVAYGSYYKPEGLIQKYSNRMRYSVFGYLNDPLDGKNGAPLRARQKFVGPLRLNKTTGLMETNPNAEWNANTGVMVQNPDPTDASSTTGTSPAITNSGVMNYLNKFGSMTGSNHKQHDPVSEMYYAAVRYLRNKSYPGEYATLSGTATTKYTQADGFPVITSWSGSDWDPMQYRCQNNSILGIGDVYTWYDKNVPGGGGSSEGLVVNDPDVDADVWLERISELEFGNTSSLSTPFNSSRSNSAYIAALAYWAHVTDLRTESDMKGKQTVSTYWVDVRENKRLEARRANQYWLAAKYGGFTVPNTYNPASPPAWQTSWWNASGDQLTSSQTGNRTPDPPEGENAVYASEVMGRPDNYYMGNQASAMVESLTRAFAKIASERAGSGSALAANSTRLDTTTRIYQAQFRNGSWFGQIHAYSIDEATGQLSASPVWSVGTHSSLAPANWASRNIYMNKPGAGHVQFRGSNLTTTQRTKMVFTGIGSATYSDVVDYLRGDKAKEEAAGGTLRTRTPPEASWSPLLGDIVNSQPVFVGAPNKSLYGASTPDFTGKSAYSAFVTAQATRTKALWVGANDGMMHAFNADTGAEIYAFVPNAAIMNGLGDYADPDYVHKYFVDGDTAVADVYIGGSWKTVLIGTMGRGGAGIFALNVTNPNSPSLLWEKSASDIPSLGRNIGQPVIAQIADGDWRVILGNGLENATGDADLISIRINDGVVNTITTGNSTGNGLNAVLARDSNGDGFADIAFAGDMQGNLWKFTGLGASGTATRLMTARDNLNNPQPITAAPLVGRDPNTGIVWVFFGTGKYLSVSDLTDTSQQTWYGIKDTGVAVTSRGDLTPRIASAGAVIDGSPTRIISEGTPSELSGKLGWYIDLPASKERMVVPNRFQGMSLIGTTRIPDASDVCAPAGTGYVMAINPFTGARLDETFFDMNRDGIFNDSDRSGSDVISGFALDGMPNAPIFVEGTMLTSLDGNGSGQADDGIDNDGDGEIDEEDEDDTDDTDERKTQGSSVEVSRMSWREVLGS
jgi:type IV pilus assembly protein PilY1